MLTDMKTKFIGLAAALAILLSFQACENNSENENSGTGAFFYIPDGFPDPVYKFQNNPVSDAGFALGRKLFYDPILSRDSTISCGSCHQQFAAFSHAGHNLSHGINGLLGNRNSPALFNIAWIPEFMWDGGINHLEVQPLAPIANPVEMDENINNVMVKLQRSPTYRTLFQNAFNTDSITVQLTMRAFAQFMGTMISANAKYDKYRNGNGTLSSQELNGLQLFRTHCASCHREPLLTDMSYRNNGLDSFFNADPGRAKITHLPQDSGCFKVPSLRNIALTSPYMHDGRFLTLGQVLDHYSTGIKQSATLDPILMNGGISLTLQEKNDLISFLESLTDPKFITDSRFKEVQ